MRYSVLASATATLLLFVYACGGSAPPSVQEAKPDVQGLLENGRAADAVIGQASFGALDVGTTNASGLKFDLSGGAEPTSVGGIATAERASGEIEIWVADSGNNRVLGWATSSAFGLTNGAPADLVLGQKDFFSTDFRDVETEARIAPTSVATDPGLNVYVSSYGVNASGVVNSGLNRVVVYENPFGTDVVPDYELADVPQGDGPLKVVPFGNGLLAVHDDEEVAFYRQGFAARIVDSTFLPPNGKIPKPTDCNRIAAVAGGASTFYVACELSVQTCGEIFEPDVVLAPDDCKANGEDAISPCYDPLEPCGQIFAYLTNPFDDPGSDPDPNRASGLPVNQVAYPAVFAGFAAITDIESTGNTLFVAEKPGTGASPSAATVPANRVLRLTTADLAASEMLPDDGDDTFADSGTQDIFDVEASDPDPGLDFGFGQEDERSYELGRGIVASNGDLSRETLLRPVDLALDAADGLLVLTSNQRVLRYVDATSAAEQDASIVLGQYNFADNAPNAIEGNGFGQAEWVAVDWNSNQVYIADSVASRVLQFDGSGLAASGSTAVKALGQDDLFAFRENLGSINNLDAETLSGPDAVFVDQSTGDVYIQDSGNGRVIRYADPSATNNPDTDFFGVDQPNNTGIPELGGGGGVAFNAGNVYAANGTEIRRYEEQGDDDGRRYGDSSTTLGPNAFGSVGGIAFQTSGAVTRMFVADTTNHRILIFENPDGPLLDAVTADDVIGQEDFYDNSPEDSSTRLSGPQGIAIDGAGRLWVADTNNNRVVMFPNPLEKNEDGLAEATYVLGQRRFDRSAALVNDADFEDARTLSGPTSVATNEAGDVVYVVDRGNNRVLRFSDSTRLVFTEGPGEYTVEPGQTISVSLATNIPADLALGSTTSASVTLTDSTVTFTPNADAEVGEQARVEIVASSAGPPAQAVSGGLIFKVVQGLNTAPSGESGPSVRTPDPRTESSCECNSVTQPWLAILGVVALFRRRRQRRMTG